MKVFALFVCAAALLVAGCSTCCEKKAACSTTASCAKGHQCCVDAHTNCANCPKCSAK